MPFRPSVHGWPFQIPQHATATLGITAPPLPELGLGGGLCWAALDRYLEGVRICRETPVPEPGEPLHSELVARQVAALAGVWDRVRRYQGLPDGSWRDHLRIPMPGRDLASLSRRAWRDARKRLTSGQPVLLTLLPETDPYSRGRSAWQVLATAFTRDGSRVTMSLYDPFQPDQDDVQLGFSLSGTLEATVSGGRRIRGFFVVPYDREVDATVRAETFADRAVIGLNRKVHGRPSGAAHRARLDVVARDAQGALLHFRRERGSHWEGANVTERQELGTLELHSDPVAATTGGRLHVFARSYVGDLLHFRLGRSWRAANRTDHKRAGARFRFASDPVPAPGPGGRLSVVGLHADGGLLHYGASRLRGWSAEQVPGEPLAHGPLGAWLGTTLHVIGVTEDQRVLAWHRGEDSWTMLDISTSRGSGPSLTIAGDPVVATHGDALHVFGRDPRDRLVHFRRDQEGMWAGAVRADGLAGDPVVTPGPAGLHVFAPAREAGLIHAWGNGEWQWEDVLATRPAFAPGACGDWTGPLLASGTDHSLRVFGRRGKHLLVMDWREDSDWTGAPLEQRQGVEERHHPADDPMLVVDGTGQPHLFATDGGGTLLHVEPVQR